MPEVIPRECHGLWRSIGYNGLLRVEAAGYRLYTVTTHSARLFEHGRTPDFARAFDRVSLTPEGRLALFHANDVTRYEFERRPQWPAGCELYDAPLEDPASNLAAFCELFKENYAFFKLRGVDWSAACEAAAPRLAASPTNATLVELLAALITPLSDMHVHIRTPRRRLRSGLTGRGPREALQAAFGLITPQLSARSSVLRLAARLRDTLLADFAVTGFQQAGNAVVSWGKLNADVGYLSLLRMFGFAPDAASRDSNDLPRHLREVGPFMAADMASLDRVLEQAMSELEGLKAMIVDARLNGGGFDRAGLLLCERLIETPHTIYRKKAWTGTGFTTPQPITVQPSPGKHFTGRVFLLISPFTVSAGEVLALAMSSLPNVTLLGEPTQGILSDNLFHRLPNDWEVSLSNEVYETLDGRCFEATGVPPHIALRPLGAARLIEDLRAGLGAAVERATAG